MFKKFCFLFLFLPLFSFAQERILLVGNIFDGVTFFPITEANIYNFSTKKYCFTNKEGNYEILVKESDTIIVSKPIYKQALIEISKEMIEKKMLDVPLYFKVIILKEINVFALPPTYEDFKRDFVNTSLSYFYKALEGTSLTTQDRINATAGNGGNLLNVLPSGFASPISYFYDKFSRKKKLERLYQELVENQDEVDRLPLKYNRELVSSITGLKGEELLDFMTFCKFSYYDLIRWSPEFIIAQINNRFDNYEFYKAIQDN
jgi:hypothetical protein